MPEIEAQGTLGEYVVHLNGLNQLNPSNSEKNINE